MSDHVGVPSTETAVPSSEDAAAALYAAVESGSLEKVCIFLKENGNDLVNSVKPESLETPLHVAARLGNSDIAKALVDAGARVDMGMRISNDYFDNLNGRLGTQNYWNADALHIAAAFGHVSVIKVLLDVYGPKPPKTDRGLHLLNFAAINGQLEALKFLMARYPEAHLKNQALCFALYYGQIECAHYLLSSGANPNESSGVGYGASKPLHFALAPPGPLSPALFPTTILKTNEVVMELVQMLVDAGADINERSTIRFSYGLFGAVATNILCCAAAYGRYEVVKYLLANEADTTIKWRSNWGVLHFAVASGRPDTVALLLKAVASDQVIWKIGPPYENDWTRDKFGKIWSALDIIGVNDDRLRDPGNTSVTNDYVKIIRLLVENGADLEAKDEFGNTPLHLACLIVDSAFKFGRKSSGHSPAGCYITYESDYEDKGSMEEDDEYARHHMLSVHRMCPFISALLQAGANPNALNKKMQNPLHVLLMDVMGGIEDLSNYHHWHYSCDWSEEKERPVVQAFFAAISSSVRVLAEAGTSLSHRNSKAYEPLHALVYGYDKYRKKMSEEYGMYDSYDPQTPQHELDPIIVELIRCGAPSWEVVPDDCIGLEKALFNIWARGNTAELSYFYDRLEYCLKARLKMTLKVLNRFLPGHKELRMQILADAL